MLKRNVTSLPVCCLTVGSALKGAKTNLIANTMFLGRILMPFITEAMF